MQSRKIGQPALKPPPRGTRNPCQVNRRCRVRQEVGDPSVIYCIIHQRRCCCEHILEKHEIRLQRSETQARELKKHENPEVKSEYECPNHGEIWTQTTNCPFCNVVLKEKRQNGAERNGTLNQDEVVVIDD